MKHLSFIICHLAFGAALLLTGCAMKTETSTSESTKFELEYFAFQEEAGGKWGLMNLDGEVAVEPTYKGAVTACLNDRFVVFHVNSELYTLYAIGEEPRKIGTYKDIGGFTGDLCPVVDRKNCIKYIDKEGNTAFELNEVEGVKVMRAFNFVCGRAMVLLEDGTWGYIDDNGETAIPFKYSDAWNFKEGLAVVYLDDPDEEGAEWAVIDTEGEVLFTKAFSDLDPVAHVYYDGLLGTKKNDGEQSQVVFLDRDGNTVLELQEGIITGYVFNGKFLFFNSESEKTGLMDTQGNVLLKDKYKKLNFNGKLLAGKASGNRYYLLDTQGEKLCRLPSGDVLFFEPQFKQYDKRLLVGTIEDGYVLVDDEGNEVMTDFEIHDYTDSFYWGVTFPKDDDVIEEIDDDEEYDEEEEPGSLWDMIMEAGEEDN